MEFNANHLIFVSVGLQTQKIHHTRIKLPVGVWLDGLPWSWLQTAWLSSCTSSAQAGLPTRLLSPCCLEELRYCSEKTPKEVTIRRRCSRKFRWKITAFNLSLLICVSIRRLHSVYMSDCGFASLPCSACQAGIRHCAAREDNSWPRRCCSGRAWLGALCHLSVGETGLRNILDLKCSFRITKESGLFKMLLCKKCHNL